MEVIDMHSHFWNLNVDYVNDIKNLCTDNLFWDVKWNLTLLLKPKFFNL